MSHEISIQNGRAEMFSGNGILPWHKLGEVVAGLLTAQQAIEAAHLGWTVKTEGLILADGRKVPEYQVLSREDNSAVLSVMKQRYEIIQNRDAFSFFDRIVGEGKATYETAGALRGGRQVWIMAKYNGEIEVNKDKSNMWILLVTSHDGSYAMSMQWVLERVVCANTLSIALHGKQNCIKIRHTEGWRNAEDEAKRTLGLTEDYFTVLNRSLAGMNDRLLTPDEMAEFSKLLLPAKDETDAPTRTLNIRSEINQLFQRGAGNNGNSRWDALNAVTDYADHHQTLRGDNSTRLESSLLGTGAALKQRAFDLLTSEDIMASLLNRSHKAAPSPANNPFAQLLSK